MLQSKDFKIIFVFHFYLEVVPYKIYLKKLIMIFFKFRNINFELIFIFKIDMIKFE